MATSDAERQVSPWLSVWQKPRVTIAWVLSHYSTIQILILAGSHLSLTVVAYIVEDRLAAALDDWRVLAAIVGAAAIGVAFLYVGALCFKWSGRLLRGTASAAELRAVLAWGNVPTVIGLSVCFAILAVWWLVAGAGVPRPGQAIPGLVQAAAAIFGLWSVVTILLMLSRVQNFGFWRTIASYALALMILLLPLLLIRTFVFEPFNAPSGSMAPTIIVGDYFFVSKYRYGYSRYSLPFAPPLISGRIMGNAPERGDVVVYRQPKDPTIDFVKRLVGLPGDRVQLVGGVLQINGQPVARESLGDHVDGESGVRRKLWRETLPNGLSYQVLDAGDSYLDNTEVYVVPEGRYFVLGDNRNNSVDSRMSEREGGGAIPFENLVGRAEVIFFSRDSTPLKKTPAIRLERMGTAIR